VKNIAIAREHLSDAMEMLRQIPVGDVPTEEYTIDELETMTDPEDMDWLIVNIAYKYLERALTALDDIAEVKE